MNQTCAEREIRSVGTADRGKKEGHAERGEGELRDSLESELSWTHPNVAFKRPPRVCPRGIASCSVASPRSFASGMTAMTA